MKRKKRFKEWVNSKGGKGFLIGSIAFLIFGLACIVVGFGLTKGWDFIYKWFTSRWAVYVYIAIGLWSIAVLSIMLYGNKEQ